MNNDIYNTIDEIKENLNNDTLIIEYKNLKRAILVSEEIQNLKFEIESLKKCNIDKETKEHLKELNNKLNNLPLIVNFKNIEEEVNLLFKDIKDILDL